MPSWKEGSISLPFIKGKVDAATWGQARRKRKSFSAPKTTPSTTIHLQFSTLNQPCSVLGTWEAQICESRLQPQEILVRGMVGE